MDNAAHHPYYPYGNMPGAWLPPHNAAESFIVYDPATGTYQYVGSDTPSEGSDEEQVPLNPVICAYLGSLSYVEPINWDAYTLRHVCDILRAAERWGESAFNPAQGEAQG